LLQKKTILEYVGVILGSFILAVGLVAFLIPHKIAAGGVSGLATISHYLTGFPVGLTMLVFNIPLFLISMKEMGMKIGIKSLAGTIALSLFIDLLTPYIPPSTQNPLLAALYGGVMSGLGLGLVFRSKGTTGGTDLGAALIHKYFKFSLGMSLLAIDGMVIILAGIVFNVEAALFALITVFVTGKVIDVVQEGISTTKAAYIISEKNAEIADIIIRELNRGVTSLNGKGIYTDKQREVLLCVVSQREVTELKDLVYDVDPNAFMIVSNVHEVLGEGFKAPKSWR
jgi:uncharacterized membrane-anchored protein YitT (DUF2179 family)